MSSPTPASEPVRITVVESEACHFCEDAHRALATLAASYPLAVDTVAVRSEAGQALMARHRAPMSPLVLLQLVGPAVALHVAETLHGVFPERFGVSENFHKFVAAGKSAVVNGKTVTGPANIVRAATLTEISFVPIGADLTTSASVAAQLSLENSMEFEAWLKANGFDPATLNAFQRGQLKAAFDAKATDADVAQLKRGALNDPYSRELIEIAVADSGPPAEGQA